MIYQKRFLVCITSRFVDNYNMIVVFFPGFDRFNPGFDRFIPGFDRFIPASIPVTGTLPLQSKCTIKCVLFCILKSFYFILFEINIFLFKMKTFINSENKYFAQKYSWHQSKAARVSFQCHRLSTVIHRQRQESVKRCKQHAKGA